MIDDVQTPLPTGWAQPAPSEDSSVTLAALIEAQAARTPAALGVVSETASLTYAQLEAQAERLADRLAQRSIGRGSVVGVALHRSVATVVSILAIFKTGAVYLPLDPAYPPERLAFMIGDAGVSLVVTDEAVQPLLPPAAAWIDVGADNGAPARTGPPARSRDIAYIMYTSGSTGKPKGVAVAHAAAVNLAFAKLAYDPIAPGDRVLASTSVGFDVSMIQLATPLVHGATIVIAGDLRTLTPDEFWRFLQIYGVTHINSVPSFIASVLGSARSSSPLKRLMLGGEAFSGALVRRLRTALPTTQLFNVYGPTETCVDATFHCVAEGDAAADVLPIGKPLPNYRTYVLDGALEPVASGVAGDLYIGGAGVALGYVNAPALTAERFIPDPFCADGGRLYATGDRARRRPDGELEFLGRADTQVKLRGHRIELGEIEAALIRLDGLREAAVVVREDVPGDRRIVAYFTADRPLAPALLTAELANTLPGFMLPALYRQLTTMPLTPNGKLDRSALPVPDPAAGRGPQRPAGDALLSDGSVAAVDELQQQLIRIWENVLGVSPIGVRDDFFALGGQSLLAVRLLGEIEARFRARLSLAALVEHPTIEQLASALRKDPASLNRSPLVKLNPAGPAPPFFYLHGSVTGGGYYCLKLAEHIGADRPLYAVRPHGADGGTLPLSIEAMAADYIAVLKSVVTRGPYLLGGRCSGGLVAYEMARQLRAAGESVGCVVMIDAPNIMSRIGAPLQLVERLSLLLRLAPAPRDGFCSALSALGFFYDSLALRLSNFTTVDDKGAFLGARSRRMRTTRDFWRRRGDPTAVVPYAPGLWELITEAYIPRAYDGSVAALFSHGDRRSAHYARGWSKVAPRVTIRSISGDHNTCVTDEIAGTAQAIAAALRGDV
jgi:amino acid adenylation domain-containing protein